MVCFEASLESPNECEKLPVADFTSNYINYLDLSDVTDKVLSAEFRECDGDSSHRTLSISVSWI